jgi:hypothetical protein
MNLTSNSGMDFIAIAKASGTNLDELMVSDEFIDWFKEYLSEKEINVTFTKKDGTNRVMKCTKQQDLIPSEKQPKGTGSTPTGDAVAVFDLEAQDWRSFNTSNITRIEWGTV